MGVVARTIAQAKSDPSLARLARNRYGLRTLIDPDTWRNELPVAQRPKSFGLTEFATGQALDLRVRPLSSADEDAYVRTLLEELTAAQTSIYLAPYHLGGGPDCPVRGLDLRLARRAADRFRALRLNEPRDSDPFPVERQVFAVICIRPHDLLDPLAQQMLVNLYRDLHVDGYVLKVASLSEQTPIAQVTAVTRFAFGLSLTTERDVILSGGKNLAYAFVGAGLSSAILGIGEGEVFSVGSFARAGGQRPTYHSGALRSVDTHTKSLGAGYRAEILFLRSPCACGHHRGDLPPEDHHQRKFHTMSERLRDFAEAREWSLDEVETTLGSRIAASDRLTTPIGYPPLPESFMTVAREASRVRRRWREQERFG